MSTATDHIPLIAKSIWSHTPESYLEHIHSLYRDPDAGKVLPRTVLVTLNKKGNPVVRVRREPKSVLPEELAFIAEELERSPQEVWVWFAERNIPILREKT